MLSCTSSRTRTYGLLLRRHFPNVAWRRPVWPDVGPGHSENGWTWPGVAPCRWSLAPIEPGLPDDAAERLAPLIGRRTALAAAGVPQASTFCQLFFRWYNHEHRHSGIGYHTPHDVHYGYASAIRAGRARRPRFRPRANPEQFARKHPSRPPARSGLDQQTGRPIEPDPVIHLSSCLNKVDRFRPGRRPEPGRAAASPPSWAASPPPRHHVQERRCRGWRELGTGMRRRIPVPHRAGNLPAWSPATGRRRRKRSGHGAAGRRKSPGCKLSRRAAVPPTDRPSTDGRHELPGMQGKVGDAARCRGPPSGNAIPSA